MPAITDVTILTTATSILVGTETGSRPLYLLNLRENGENIILNFAGSTDDYTLKPGKYLVALPGMVITGTSASGAAVLQVLRGVVPDDDETSPAYDATLGALLSWRTNPERNYTLPQQASDSGAGDGTTEWYIDFEGYREVTLQVQDTPGVAGNNTYRVYISAEAGNNDDDSAVYVDVTLLLFGAATFTTDFCKPSTQPFRAKYIKVERVRAADGGNNDGGTVLDIQGG
jgi:hypothetical protein